MPSNTYIATWLAVSIVGATPVPVEPLLSSYCIDPALVEKAITKRTRAVLPVHLYGHPADMIRLSEICTQNGLYLISDAAQAHGAYVGQRSVGQLGDIVAWSFYPSKNLGAFGDAGAITTQNSAIAERVRALRNYGSSKKYFNKEKGLNSRLDPIQASVLRVKLRCLLDWNSRRERIANHYISQLSGLPIGLPSIGADITHAWHVFVVTTPRRDSLQKYLDAIGISTLIHYPLPPFRQEAYSEFNGRADEWPYAVTETNLNSFLISGNSQSNNGDVVGNHGGLDYWMVNLSSTGSIVWQNVIAVLVMMNLTTR